MKHLLAALCLVTACTDIETPDENPEGELDVAARYVDPGGPTCPEWGCGANSATVGDGLIFDELDSSGVSPNRGGLTIVGAKLASGLSVKVRVYRHWLYAIDASGATYWDTALDNMIIQLKHPTYGIYEALIANASPNSPLYFWAGAADKVPYYDIRTRRLGELKFAQYACKSELTSDPGWTSDVHRAVIFQGDRYDAKFKKVSETSPSDPWFNIACAGTSPA